jgi:hypothetical protein
MPSADTVAKTYDYLDVARAAETFLAGVPATSAYSVMGGFKEAGLQPGDLGLAEELLDARSLFLTPNTTTVYAMLEFDVKDGPFVMEIPPGVLGPVQDAFFRFVVDFGPVGPDQGKGGKHVIAQQSYKGALPRGAFEVRSRTYRNMAFFRVFVKDGDIAAAARSVKSSFRCYPLAQADNPPEQKFVNVSGKPFNTIHSNDFKFFEELNAVIQYEPRRRPRSRAARTLRVDRHQEGPALCARRTDEAAARGRRGHRQCRGSLHLLRSPRPEHLLLFRPPVVRVLRQHLRLHRKWGAQFRQAGSVAVQRNWRHPGNVDTESGHRLGLSDGRS